MRSPPTQRHARRCIVISSALVALLAFVQVATAQSGSGFDGGGDPGVSLVVQAVAAGLITLVIGGLFIVAAPEYTGQVTDRALNEPAKTFLFGAGIFVAVIGTAFVLAITIIGLIVAIPLLFIYVLFALVAGEIGYLTAGRLVSDDWPVVLLVAIGVAFVVGGVPILGGLIGFVLGCIGVGAVVVDYREDDGDGYDGTTDADGVREPSSGLTEEDPDGYPDWGDDPGHWGNQDQTGDSDDRR